MKFITITKFLLVSDIRYDNINSGDRSWTNHNYLLLKTNPDFFDILKGKHLLLDTSVFIDASIHETEFAGLFNKLRDNNTTLVTIALVLFEFLKGAPDITKFKAKKASVEKIIDAYLPSQISMEKDFSDLTEYETLINQYKLEPHFLFWQHQYKNP